jgi:hypothetical protein
MKSVFSKLALAAGIMLALTFTISCSTDDSDDSDYGMLNGTWDRGDIVVTFNGSSGVFTEIQSNSGWQTVKNNGSIKIGDKKFKDISGKDLKWTCQERTYNQLTYISESWEDCTITMSSDGKTITVVTPEAAGGASTYTKVE